VKLSNPWRGLGGLSSQIWLVCAADFINRAGTMALVFLVPYLTQQRHWSLATAGAAVATYGGSRLVFGLFTGPVIDRLGAVRVLRVSFVGAGLSLIAIPFAGSRVLVFALLVAWAAFAQAASPACMSLLASLAPSDRRRGVFALQRLGANLGMSIGPAVGGFVANVNYDWVFWCNGATALAAATFAFTRLRNVVPEGSAATKRLSRSAWADLRLLYLLACFVPVTLVFFQTEGTLSYWILNELHRDPPVIGFVFTLNTVLIVLIELPLNLATGKLPHRPVFIAGAVCIALGFGSLGFVHSLPGLFGTVVLWTFGEMILVPGLADAVAALAPAERRGGYMAMYSLMFSGTLSLGPWLGMQLYAASGPIVTWQACLGLGGLSILLLARLHSHPSEAAEAAVPVAAPVAEAAE
jgi:MFS family permease